METNWNQLIERYLQNELSEEGKIAFEQELQLNPELREELEMHRLVQDAAKRASQRMVVKQAGKTYLRNLRIKQFSIGILITTALAAGIIFVMQKNKQADQSGSKQTALLSEQTSSEDQKQNENENENENENVVIRTLNENVGQGQSDSLVYESLHNLNKEEHKKGANSEGVTKQVKQAEHKITSAFSLQTKKIQNVSVKQPVKKEVFKGENWVSQTDTTRLAKPTVAVLGFTNENLDGRVVESQTITASQGKNTAWMQQYDSIGKFNDLYCGYALVMDQAKFGFVDRQGKVFIPLVYDQIVVTVNIKSSKQKNKQKSKKKVLYIPKRSGSEVKDCEENMHPLLSVPAENKADSVSLKQKK